MENGQFILSVLREIGEPATCESVVAFIANVAKVQPKTIMGIVAETLEGGVEYGFIEKQKFTPDDKEGGSKYSLIPKQPSTPDEESETASEGESDDEMQDRGRRRQGGGKKRRSKRGGGRRRRSSRSRSRRSHSRRRKH